MKSVNKFKPKTFLSVFLRSLFIQNVWNYQSYLSIGLSFCLIPIARKLMSSKDDLTQFLNRHLNFFNSHPYFASYAIGAIAKVEEQLVLEDNQEYDTVERLKNALIGPLGAVGDQLFWANIKPTCLMVGILGLWMIDNYIAQLILLGVVFLLYNIPHLYIRISGLRQGYRLGFQVYKILNLDHFTFLKKPYGAVGAIALGIIIGTSLIKLGKIATPHAAIFIISTYGTYIFWKWKQNFYGSIVFPLFMAILIGIFIELL
jgi:PTS system mannose-specific IID component